MKKQEGSCLIKACNRKLCVKIKEKEVHMIYTTSIEY